MKDNIINNVKIGADIEGFVENTATHEIVSAEPYIKGTKHDPFKFDLEKGDEFSAMSLDNVLAEICIPPVPLTGNSAADRECFVKHINHSFGAVAAMLPAGYCTTHIPSAILDEKFLKTESAILFGCESDYNVWLREANVKPVADNQCLRSAGFHVHVGYDNPNTDATEQAVKALDLFLSVPSILVEPENERRKLYGKAGAFRFKPYGFEHRVLSGYFASSDALKGWVFDNTEKALEFVNKGGFNEIDASADIIQKAINENNKVLAGNLIRQFNITLP